jgi:PTH1 family peptidyl-tRNA hydrolase
MHSTRRAQLLIVGLGNVGNQYQFTRHNIGFHVVDEFAKRLHFPTWTVDKRLNAQVSSKTITFQNYSSLQDSVMQREQQREYNRLKHEQIQRGVPLDQLQLPHHWSEISNIDESIVKDKMNKLVFFPQVQVHLMKPETFMNLSGRPVRSFVDSHDMKLSMLNKHCRILVVTDDVSLTFGTMKLRYKGGSGGHNGLADVEKRLGTDKYHRLRMGIAPREHYTPNYIQFVLQKFNPDERKDLTSFIDTANDLIIDYIHQDLKLTSATGSNREI